MKIKTAELEGDALDWAVAQYEYKTASPDEYFEFSHAPYVRDYETGNRIPFTPSTDWSQGGPIIERELIDLNYDIHWIRDLLDPDDNGDRWYASKAGQDEQGCYGPTPLIAAMRCYVTSKLGNEVTIPKELV